MKKKPITTLDLNILLAAVIRRCKISSMPRDAKFSAKLVSLNVALLKILFFVGKHVMNN